MVSFYKGITEALADDGKGRATNILKVSYTMTTGLRFRYRLSNSGPLDQQTDDQTTEPPSVTYFLIISDKLAFSIVPGKMIKNLSLFVLVSRSLTM